MRTQQEIRKRLEELKNGKHDDFLGFKFEALVLAATKETVQDWLKEDATWDEQFDIEQYLRVEAEQYLVFAIGKALDHRGISASRSIDKLSEWLWALGEDSLLGRFHSADYAPYGAPKLAVLETAWDVQHDDKEHPTWINMRSGNRCTPNCVEGC